MKSNIRKFLSKCIKLYIRYFPIRKGKIPVLLFFGKLGCFKGIEIEGDLMGNVRAILNLNDWVQQLVYFFGVYEFEKKETEAWLKLNEPNSTILDIGANFGYYSLLSASISNSIKAIAFEPAPKTFLRLVDNIKLNEFSSVIPNNVGVSNCNGSFTLYLADDDNSGMTSLSMPESYSGNEVKVEVVVIDEFVVNKISGNLRLVKIDVEGNELNVLLGMSETIAAYKPILFIELLNSHLNRFGHSIDQVFNYLYNKDYLIYEYDKTQTFKKLNTPTDVGLAICMHKSLEINVLRVILDT